jgi:L-ascorbate metabolism protein UlaG (beta-lactamase superfamily)
MKTLVFLAAFGALLTTSAQDRGDILNTSQGPLRFQPVFHGALALKWKGKTILVDPYGGIKKYKGLQSPDVVLITDIHPDHLDSSTLYALDLTRSTLIVPQAVADKLPETLKKNIVVLANGKSHVMMGMTIEAIPMYNLPEKKDAGHPKGRGNGYLLTTGGKRIYISGDTEDIPEMLALKNIDVAFVCMNLPYTMTVEQAAEAVKTFKPLAVYPYHYRGKDGMSDIEQFKELVSDTKGIEVRLRDWYKE